MYPDGPEMEWRTVVYGVMLIATICMLPIVGSLFFLNVFNALVSPEQWQALLGWVEHTIAGSGVLFSIHIGLAIYLLYKIRKRW